MSVDAPRHGLAEVLDLFERWGGDPYDEEIPQLDHALQAAALASEAGAGDALVAAALLHDVGHLLALAARGDGPHERIGAQFAAASWPAEVARPIALHVAAKRYLCGADPAYAAELSAGSTRSLVVQGGPMTRAERTTFEATPGWEDALRLRRWDDGAKRVDADVAPLVFYEPMLWSLACSAS